MSPRSTVGSLVAPNKQLQRPVTRRCGDGTNAPFHYALVSPFMPQHAAAELQR